MRTILAAVVVSSFVACGGSELPKLPLDNLSGCRANSDCPVPQVCQKGPFAQYGVCQLPPGGDGGVQELNFRGASPLPTPCHTDADCPPCDSCYPSCRYPNACTSSAASGGGQCAVNPEKC